MRRWKTFFVVCFLIQFLSEVYGLHMVLCSVHLTQVFMCLQVIGLLDVFTPATCLKEFTDV